MVAAGATCLAVEADKTIIIDQAEVVRFADKHKMAIIALHKAEEAAVDPTIAESHAA